MTKRVSIFPQATPLDFLEFDGSIQETYGGDATITDHPVEEGSDITDHIRRKPETFMVHGIVSNHPIITARSLRAKPSIRGGDPNTRAEDAYGFLLGLKNNGTLVGASTTLRDYTNMAIASMPVTRDAVTGNILDVTVHLREIIIAQTEKVAAPEPVNVARKNKVKLGKKPKTPATPAVDTKTRSAFIKIGNAFSGP